MKKNILSGEPLLALKPSAIYAFLRSLPFTALGLLFLWLAFVVFGALIWVSLTWMLLAFHRFLSIRVTRYLIGPETLGVRTGIFSTRVDSLEMYRVRDYVMDRPLIYRLFRLMNLTLQSRGQGEERLCLKGLPVSDILHTIGNHVQQARLKNRIVELAC